MNEPICHESPVSEGSNTGLPILRTWRGVYFFVLGVFITYVVLLFALTQAYS